MGRDSESSLRPSIIRPCGMIKSMTIMAVKETVRTMRIRRRRIRNGGKEDNEKDDTPPSLGGGGQRQRRIIWSKTVKVPYDPQS